MGGLHALKCFTSLGLSVVSTVGQVESCPTLVQLSSDRNNNGLNRRGWGPASIGQHLSANGATNRHLVEMREERRDGGEMTNVASTKLEARTNHAHKGRIEGISIGTS